MQPVIPPKSPSATRSERRAWPRYRLWSGGGHIFLAAGHNAPHAGQLRNLSRGGAAILTAQRHDPGTVVTVDIRYTVWPYPRTLVGRVVWVTEDRDSYLLGVAFVTPLTDDDLGNLVAVVPA